MLTIIFNRFSITRLVTRLTLLCGFAIITTGCVNDAQVINQADQVNTQLAPATLKDPELTQYLQKVGDRIIESAKALSAEGYGPDSHKKADNAWMFSSAMQFHFVNSKTINAFTTGGEHMYVYNALFQSCRTEDELAAVMAHEYGHVYARHVEKGMNRQYAILGGTVLAGGAGYLAGGEEHGKEYASLAAAAAGGLGTFIGMGFTREDESQADQLGFTFYTHAGWDPARFADFFKFMIDQGFDTTPELLSDHPSLANRVKAIEKWVHELPPQAAQWRKPPVASPAQFRQLQQRAAQLAKTTPDDKSLQQAQALLNAFPSCVAAVETPKQKEARAVMQQELAQQSPPKK